MRKALVAAMLAAFLVPTPGRASAGVVIAADGDFFYRSNVSVPDSQAKGDPALCRGDSNEHTGRLALRHWHVGVPIAGADAELAGGFGCLGGPKTFTVEVPDGGGLVVGSVRYTWDQNVPGGCCNDVHLHAFDADGNLVASTFETDGYQPVVPAAIPVGEHDVAWTLGAGVYTIVEDVFAGEHTAWLTNLMLQPGAA